MQSWIRKSRKKQRERDDRIKLLKARWDAFNDFWYRFAIWFFAIWIIVVLAIMLRLDYDLGTAILSLGMSVCTLPSLNEKYEYSPKNINNVMFILIVLTVLACVLYKFNIYSESASKIISGVGFTISFAAEIIKMLRADKKEEKIRIENIKKTGKP